MSIRKGTNIIAGRSPYQPSLFDFKWADHILNDPQWIRADNFTWHSRTVFTPAYDHLVADIQGKDSQSETIEGIIITYYLASDGHKICLADQEEYLKSLYAKTGSAWYYLLDTTTQSFKTPRTKWGLLGLKNEVGKYTKFNLPNLITSNEYIAANQMYLYFYAGNFNQEAIVNTAGANLTDIENAMENTIEALADTMSDLDTMINAQYHPNILESKWTDSILNDIQWLRSNTFSWQSGQVYETAYNHLVSDITGKAPQYRYFPNVECKGETKVDENGILSGFLSTSSHGVINGLYKPTTSFELVVKAKLPTTITDQQNMVGSDPTVNYTGTIIRVTSATTIKVWISSNGSSWNVVDGGTYTYNNITPGEDIWIKLTWDGSTYTTYASINGVDYTSIGTVSSTAVMNYSTGKASLGGYETADRPFTGGTIDLRESYIKIDGNLVWKGVDTLTYYEADDGHKICLADQEERVNKTYNSTGMGWYYILDQVNTRFKLPRKHSTQIVESVRNKDGTWYRLYADGWVEQGGEHTATSTSAYEHLFNLPIEMQNTDYIVMQDPVSSVDNDCGEIICESRATTAFRVRISDFASTSGSKGVMWQVSGQSAMDMTKYQANEKYLYFYVGKFLQTAVINTAGLNTELFNDKVDRGHEVIAFQAPTSENEYTWYRKYADGWVEQGGISNTGLGTSGTITLPITMQDNNYTAIAGNGNNAANNYFTISRSEATATTIKWYKSATGLYGYWQVSGMAA